MKTDNKNSIIIKEKNKILSKFLFFNMKTLVLTFILALIWIVVFIFLIWPNKHYHYMEGMNIVSLGNLLIIVLVGGAGKIIYRNIRIKCRHCNFISTADKWYCGNCGEKLDGDLFKKS
jgi:uncharacterized membrane protein YqjE